MKLPTNALRFCYIVDPGAFSLSARRQVEAAIRSGVTLIRYPEEAFSLASFHDLVDIQNLCRSNNVLFLVDNDPILAKAIAADGVHLDRSPEKTTLAKGILGEEAKIGITLPVTEPPEKYIGCHPTYMALPLPFSVLQKTSSDSNRLKAFHTICAISPIPILAAVGSDLTSISPCIERGAAGIAVRGKDLPHALSLEAVLSQISASIGIAPRLKLSAPWQDEFALISRLVGPGNSARDPHGALRIPPGDDACLLRDLSTPVVTTDTQREAIHFRFDWQRPDEVGYKAVCVTLSDLAASYARPVALFINLCLPRYLSEETILSIYAGIDRALAQYGCALGGGNTSRGNDVALDLFAVGEGRSDIFPTRTAALPGFGLYVTGPLGLARAGLEALRLGDPDFPGLVERFKAPAARFDAAEILADHGVRCVMDISDGLAGDARHIAKASHLSIEIDLQGLAPGSELISFCEKYGEEPDRMAVAGGEDYELLFACPPETFSRIARMLPEAFCVGRCLEFRGELLVGKAAHMSSFQHG